MQRGGEAQKGAERRRKAKKGQDGPRKAEGGRMLWAAGEFYLDVRKTRRQKETREGKENTRRITRVADRTCVGAHRKSTYH